MIPLAHGKKNALDMLKINQTQIFTIIFKPCGTPSAPHMKMEHGLIKDHKFYNQSNRKKKKQVPTL
jgi:hypothetical protein